MMKKTLNILLIICLLLMTLSFFTVYFRQPGEIIKTDTITKYDTLWKNTVIVKVKPVEKERVILKTDTVYTKTGDSILLNTEHKTYQERLVSDLDTCDLKIYTTGIETSLDSVKMRLRTHTDVITNTVEITKYVQKKKRLYISPQVGVGYGLINNKFDAYVGVGIGFNI